MSDYPENLVRRRHLFSGVPVTIRPIRPEDKDIEQSFVRGLSQDSRYYRFMEQMRELSPDKLKYFTEIDYDRHMALIATVEIDGREREVAVARYVAAQGNDSCEFAIAVDDAYQGTGLAGMLMATLIDSARAHGFKTMEGLVLTDNHKMLKFARQLGFEIRPEPGEPGSRRIVLRL